MLKVSQGLISKQFLSGEMSFLNSRAKKSLKEAVKRIGKEVFFLSLPSWGGQDPGSHERTLDLDWYSDLFCVCLASSVQHTSSLRA